MNIQTDLQDTRTRGPRRHQPAALTIVGETTTPQLVDVRGETLTSLTWPQYMAWRRTKTPPSEDRPVNELIIQATLGLVGELAELAAIVLANGPVALVGGSNANLIDEAGDVLFYASWALDAWGKNPLAEAEDLELVRVAAGSDLERLALILATHGEQALGDARIASTAYGFVVRQLIEAQAAVGLTADAIKKQEFHAKPQDIDVQVGRIAAAMIAVNQILLLANSNIEEALRVNRTKLDKRYPNGFEPGGGIREGEVA